MDEPPEAKQPLQELGEGSQPAQKPNLPKNGLPMGGAPLLASGICHADMLQAFLRSLAQSFQDTK